MITNFNSRIQKLEAKLNPIRRNVEPLYHYNEQTIEEALKIYNERESLNCKIDDLKSWSKQIMKDLTMYFPPAWSYEDYRNNQLNRKSTIDLSKYSNEELKEFCYKYDPIFKQIEEAIEKERYSKKSNINYIAS
jgi:hypothetical protein